MNPISITGPNQTITGITRTITNQNANTPFTNVVGTFTVPDGLLLTNVVAPSGTTFVTPIWYAGTINGLVSKTLQFDVKVLDINKAYTYTHEGQSYFGFLITFVASSDQGNLESNTQDNTFNIPFKLDGVCATQPYNYYNNLTNNFAPPTPCGVDDPYQNVSGNVMINDTLCGNGCTTTAAYVTGSAVNCTVNAFDVGNGNYNVTITDATVAWSFTYTLSCSNCPSGSNYGPFGPYTVSGTPLIGDATILNAVQDNSAYGVLTYSNGIYTFTPAFGAPVTFYGGLVQVPPVTKSADATLLQTEVWARIDASANDVELTLPLSAPVGYQIIVTLAAQTGIFVGAVTAAGITGSGTTYTFTNVGEVAIFKHVGSDVWDIISQ